MSFKSFLLSLFSFTFSISVTCLRWSRQSSYVFSYFVFPFISCSFSSILISFLLSLLQME